MRKISLRLSSFFGLLAVALGAFGAHSLKPHLSPESYGNFETAVQYQFFHALALLGVGALSHFGRKKLLSVAAGLFSAGIVGFSGSLYLLSTDELLGMNMGWAGPITPIGGLLMMGGWVCVFASTFYHFDRSYKTQDKD